MNIELSRKEAIDAARKAVGELRTAATVAWDHREADLCRSLNIAAWEIEQAIEDAEGRQP